MGEEFNFITNYGREVLTKKKTYKQKQRTHAVLLHGPRSKDLHVNQLCEKPAHHQYSVMSQYCCKFHDRDLNDIEN